MSFGEGVLNKEVSIIQGLYTKRDTICLSIQTATFVYLTTPEMRMIFFQNILSGFIEIRLCIELLNQLLCVV